MPDLRVLAFDTSGRHCAAALTVGGRIVAERHESLARGQAERLMPMLRQVMADEGAAWEELDAIGVGTGPGNFTGVRISVAAARGLSLALGIPAVGITGFQAVRELLEARIGRTLTLLPAPGDHAHWQAAEDDRPLAVGRAPFGNFDYHRGDADRPGVISLVDPDPPMDWYEVEGVRIAGCAPVAQLAAFEAKIGGAIARLAGEAVGAGEEFPRPAPLYLRSPDARPMTPAVGAQ